jgi:hypothetical protein
VANLIVKFDWFFWFKRGLDQGDQIGQNFAIWAIFYGKLFSRKNRPMIWAKFWS